ncbi:MAG: nuclear transport factor 2 family protein [Actinomycetota bacterium]|nr:nuclear transport factor 2 family protein [Actinomycetota bacterium]
MDWSALFVGIVIGLVVALSSRALLIRLLKVKFNRDVAKLNAGDYAPLLRSYRDDAVLHFNDGEHRWAGEHHGKAAIERFLQDFVKAGVQGEISEVFIGGPPWRMTLLARFDDRANAPDGTPIYSNHTVLVVRTAWGRIYEQFDFYEDTSRILGLEKRLIELGIIPVPG